MDSRILLIDDDDDDQLIFRELIQEISVDIECVIAGNGVEAFRLLATMDPLPILIFLDLNMPFMSGWEFLEKIKMDDRINKIPIVILTTSDQHIDKKKAKGQGVSNYLTKTANLGWLRQRLQEILNPLTDITAHNQQ